MQIFKELSALLQTYNRYNNNNKSTYIIAVVLKTVDLNTTNCTPNIFIKQMN